MSSRRSILAAAALALGCAAIPEPTAPPVARDSSFAGYASPKYGDGKMWLCRPDLPSDACRVDLTATEIEPDGTRRVVPHVPARAPKVDCFYVYPTVDLGILPDNHTDFRDLEPMATTTAAQAALFGETCNLYVPLYRQVTIGTYVFDGSELEARLAVAFSDVADAFAHYLGQYNHGRKVALIGHSQGAEMVVRLLRRYFEGNPVLRERLLVAMAIGGSVEVPRGRLTGGTLPTVPVCSRPDELGCVVAYHSHRAGTDVTPGRAKPKPGNQTVCVSPPSVEANERRWFSRTLLPAGEKARKLLRGISDVRTPFVLFRDFYAGQCVDGPSGYRYLAVSEAPGPGDVRKGPIDLGSFMLNTELGTHILDFQFAEGDLVDMVARRAAALP